MNEKARKTSIGTRNEKMEVYCRTIGELELRVITSRGIDELKGCVQAIAAAVDELKSNLGDGSLETIKSNVFKKFDKMKNDIDSKFKKLKERLDNV